MIVSESEQISSKKWSRRSLQDNSKSLFESRLALGELFCLLPSQQSVEVSKMVNMSRSSLYRLKRTAKQVLYQGQAYRIPKLGKPGFLTDKTRQIILHNLVKDNLLKDNLPLKQQIPVSILLPYIQKHFPPSISWHITHPQLYREWNRCHKLYSQFQDGDNLPAYPLVKIDRDQEQQQQSEESQQNQQSSSSSSSSSCSYSDLKALISQ